jgi:hypothetical protein
MTTAVTLGHSRNGLPARGVDESAEKAWSAGWKWTRLFGHGCIGVATEAVGSVGWCMPTRSALVSGGEHAGDPARVRARVWELIADKARADPAGTHRLWRPRAGDLHPHRRQPGRIPLRQAEPSAATGKGRIRASGLERTSRSKNHRARDQRLNAAAVARFHGAKGFVPVVGKDACGVVEPSAAARSFASLDFSLMSYRCTAAEAVAALRG